MSRSSAGLLHRMQQILRAGVGRCVDVLLAASLWLALLLVLGVTQVLYGVFILFGAGWASIVGGLICLALCVVILIGMSRG